MEKLFIFLGVLIALAIVTFIIGYFMTGSLKFWQKKDSGHEEEHHHAPAKKAGHGGGHDSHGHSHEEKKGWGWVIVAFLLFALAAGYVGYQVKMNKLAAEKAAKEAEAAKEAALAKATTIINPLVILDSVSVDVKDGVMNTKDFVILTAKNIVKIVVDPRCKIQYTINDSRLIYDEPGPYIEQNAKPTLGKYVFGGHGESGRVVVYWWSEITQKTLVYNGK